MNAPSNVTLHRRYLFLCSFSHIRGGPMALSSSSSLCLSSLNALTSLAMQTTSSPPHGPSSHISAREGKWLDLLCFTTACPRVPIYTSIYYSLLWHLPLEDLLRRHARGLWETSSSSSSLSVAVFDEIAPNFSNSEPSQPRDELWTTSPPSSSGAHAPRWGKSFLVFALGKIVLKE